MPLTITTPCCRDKDGTMIPHLLDRNESVLACPICHEKLAIFDVTELKDPIDLLIFKNLCEKHKYNGQFPPDICRTRPGAITPKQIMCVVCDSLVFMDLHTAKLSEFVTIYAGQDTNGVEQFPQFRIGDIDIPKLKTISDERQEQIDRLWAQQKDDPRVEQVSQMWTGEGWPPGHKQELADFIPKVESKPVAHLEKEDKAKPKKPSLNCTKCGKQFPYRAKRVKHEKTCNFKIKGG